MNLIEKATVVGRKILHDGIELGTVIEVAVPKKAKRLSFPCQGEETGGTYLHFVRPVKGGVVNIHVRTDQEVQGQTVRANLQVVHKTMSDGREFLYIDLFPVDLPETNQLHVFGEQHEGRTGWSVYELDGFVPTICLAEANDSRYPQSRSVVRYSDGQNEGTGNSPFAALSALR